MDGGSARISELISRVRIDGAAKVGAHRTSMLQDLDKGRAIELDALLTVVQEMGLLVDVDTPTINIVLALSQQMGRVAGSLPCVSRVGNRDL